MDHLKIQKFAVIGYSLGGAHASIVIQNLNDRVENALLIAPISETMLEEDPKLMLKLLSLPVIREILNYFLIAPYLRTKKGMETFMQGNGPVSYEDSVPNTDIFINDAIRSINDSIIGFNYALNVAKRPWPVDLSKLTNNGKRKIILVYCEKDDILSPHHQQYMHEKITGSEIVKIPHGHLYIFKNPTWFLDKIDSLFTI